MDKQAIIEKLREMMKASSEVEADWDSVTEASAIQDLGFDSLSILDLIYDIQQEFSLEFDAEEMASVTTVGELASFLEQKMP